MLATGEPSGAGGREVTLSFYGQGRFEGQDHVLRTTFLPAESQDAVRREMVRMISIGLVPYASQTDAVGQLAVTLQRRPNTAPLQQTDDPWNRWSFRLQMSGNASGERTSKNAQINTNVSANRTTADLKMNFSSRFSYRQSTFTLPDGRQFISPNRDYGVNGLMARTINGHWSFGTRASYNASTFSNLDSAWYVAPAIEYDIFPYSESTRRIFTLQYSAGVRAFTYNERTIYNKLEEMRGAHVFASNVNVRQRWGTIGASFEARSYLPEVGLNSVGGFGDISLNIYRGLSFSFGTSIESIRDQLFLRAAEVTTEEVLVRQRQLATRYRYQIFFGAAYTFGSIFSQVVNPRLSSGGF